MDFMDTYDYVIVGAGLSGGVLARKLAEERNKKILIIERRSHIAGNMYDYNDVHGIRVQLYGPHVFHTEIEEIYQFLIRFCEPVPYKTRCEAVIDGISTPSPFNFKTIDQFYDKKTADRLKKTLSSYYFNQKEVTVLEMLESLEPSIKGYAQFLFEKDYKPYTAKQWNLNPSEIDPSVLGRVPIVLSYRDTYFNDEYEFIPKEGFEEFYRKLIGHPNIAVKLGVDAMEKLKIDEEQKIIYYEGEKVNLIYTGAIDELFHYKYGVLPYRSLKFEFQSFQRESFQNTAIVAYPQEKGYTRITEYTKMPKQTGLGWTSVAYEYPIAYDKKIEGGTEPYYPVLTCDSEEKYGKYRMYASKFRNLILCGRLAEFKYFNMDQCVLRALEIYNSMEEV